MSATVPSSVIGEGDSTPSGPANFAEPINSNPKSRMTMVLDSVSHPQPLSSGIAGSSGATSPRASGSQPSSSPVYPGSARASPAASASVRGSCKYLRDRLAHRDAEFADLDERYIQRKEVVTDLEVCLQNLRASLDASERERTKLRGPNKTPVSERDTARQSVSALTTRFVVLEAQAQVSRTPPF